MPANVVLPPPRYAEVNTSASHPAARSRRNSSTSQGVMTSSGNRGNAVTM
jgi:hypothetical protein